MSAPHHRLSRLFEIDLRSLALFRIGLAAAILLDLASRARDLTAHYTDAGVLPREILAMGLQPSIGRWIATYWPGEFPAAVLFFGIYAAAAVLLLVGFRTRTATVLCWLCQLGLLARNPLVLHRADTLVKMLLFWSMFLPLAARWSVDRWLARRRGQDVAGADTIVSPFSAALLLQPCMMFWFAVLSRSAFEWWYQASALYYASHCDVIVRPLGARLKELPPRVLVPLTRAVVMAEVTLPLLLWSPWATSRLRITGVALLVLLPVAFGLAFYIGLFPLTCVVAVLPFIPGRVWKRTCTAHGAADEATPRPAHGARWTGIVGVGLLLFSVALNLDAHPSGVTLPRALRAVGAFVGLNQHWDIFAPTPPKQDEWFVVLGRLRDGSVVDLLRGGASPSLDKPANFNNYWKGYRWRRYWHNLRNFPTLHAQYVTYAARVWDRRHAAEQQLDAVRVELVRERTPPFGAASTLQPLERQTVWPPRADPSGRSPAREPDGRFD